VSPYHALFSLLVAALVSLPIYAEDIEFPGLQALMSPEEFANTGLDKLTPLQRAALNRWLGTHAQFELVETEAKATEAQEQTAAEAAAARQIKAKRLTRAQRDAAKVVQTRIAGPFKGWSGTTLFVLENGQYWKQRQPGRYFYRAESPDVELYKTRLGFWEMKVLATGKTVKVSRFQPRN